MAMAAANCVWLPRGGQWQWNSIVATLEQAMSCLPFVWEASVFLIPQNVSLSCKNGASY